LSLVLWEPGFSVGVGALDVDHIVIMSLMNHIDDAKQHGSDERTVAALVEALITYASGHFRREERLMARNHYPQLELHVREHRLLEQQLGELHEAYSRTPDPEISREIMELLNLWLVRHILNVDMRYRPYLQKT
jgi:hemerythrin